MRNYQVIRRLSCLGGAIQPCRDRIMIRFSYPSLLRFFSIATLMAVSIVIFLQIRTRNEPAMKPWDFSLFTELLSDLNGMGILTSDINRAVYLGDHTSQFHSLIDSHIGSFKDDETAVAIGSETLDFVFADGDDSSLQFANKVLKIGGIAAVQIGIAEPFQIPSNFRIVYIRRFSSTVIALRKIAGVSTSISSSGTGKARILLSMPEEKIDALNGMEGVALEPPARENARPHQPAWYLSDLLGDSLADYRRRIFVDVGPAGQRGNGVWFVRQYPTRNLDFEIIRVDVNDAGCSPESSGGGIGSMSDWLRRNTRDEDFVVMKAEAEAVEDILNGRAISLVDELFLECRNQWQKEKGGKKSRRAYWECLALYGKLRDAGVAVHQWWE